MVKPLDSFDRIVGKIKIFETDAPIESLYFGDLVFVKPQIFKFGGILEPLGKQRSTSMWLMPQLMRVSDLRPRNRLITFMWPKSSRTSSMTSILSISFMWLSLKPFMRFCVNPYVQSSPAGRCLTSWGSPSLFFPISLSPFNYI